MLEALNSIANEVSTLKEQLPSAMATAVREHDVKEALRKKLNEEEKAGLEFKCRVARCMSMQELAALKSTFSWSARHNEFTCANCYRFGTDSNAWKGGGSGDGLKHALPGVIKGNTPTRSRARSACSRSF